MLALSGVLLITGCSSSISDRDLSQISTSRARELGSQAQQGEDVLLIDTRSTQAFEQGHIPGARNLRLGDLGDDRVLDSLRGFDRLVVYGRNPGDAASKGAAKLLLAEKGIGEVYYFAGGVESWQDAGYPLASGQ